MNRKRLFGIPPLNPQERRINQHYQRYKHHGEEENEDERNSSPFRLKSKFVIVTIALIIVMIVFAIIILGYNKQKRNSYQDIRLLTNVVYNAVVEKEEKFQLKIDNKRQKFSNNFYYESLVVHRSYTLKATLNIVLSPYLDDYIIGDEVDIIVAMIDLYGGNTGKYPMAQNMIIFCYKENIYGFLSPTSGIIDEFNPRKEDQLEFASYIFLTRNEVVKYYEKEEMLYHFHLEELTENRIELSIKKFDVNDFVGKDYDVNVIANSYVELNSGLTLNLINLAFVERVEVEALITGIESEEKKLFVSSIEAPTLQSVIYRFKILGNNNQVYQITDLKVGDRIKVCYYQRYHTYVPIHIIVDNIELI